MCACTQQKEDPGGRSRARRAVVADICAGKVAERQAESRCESESAQEGESSETSFCAAVQNTDRPSTSKGGTSWAWLVMVTPPTVRAWGGCLPVPSRTVPLHAQSVAFSAQEGGREQQAVRKHKRSTGLVHAAGHVVSGWEQCAHAQHVGKRGFRHQSASWHTCRANMFAEHLKLHMYNVPSEGNHIFSFKYVRTGELAFPRRSTFR